MKRIIKIMEKAQHLSFIMQQFSVSKHRLSYFDNNDNDDNDDNDNEDTLFISIIEKNTYYLQKKYYMIIECVVTFLCKFNSKILHERRERNKEFQSLA